MVFCASCLVEDNTVNQLLAMRMLEKRGHTVTMVDNGQAALDALEKATFDLVLMDVQMPVMDGLVATAAIRAKEKFSGAHIPIVAMTAHAMAGDEERCIAAGMDGYLSKPIHLEALSDVLRTYAPVPARCWKPVRHTGAGETPSAGSLDAIGLRTAGSHRYDSDL